MSPAWAPKSIAKVGLKERRVGQVPSDASRHVVHGTAKGALLAIASSALPLGKCFQQVMSW